MSANGMIPGQEPYTDEQRSKLDEMLRDAMDAEDEFDVDELEREAARDQRADWKREDW